MPLTKYSQLTPLKIWWSIFWPANIKIIVCFIYMLLLTAVTSVVVFSSSLSPEIALKVNNFVAITIKWIHRLAAVAKEAPKVAYVIGTVTGTLLLTPFYYFAFKKLNSLTYKDFILELPEPNNFKALIKTFIPLYLAWNTLWIIADFLITFYVLAYISPVAEVFSLACYLILTHFTFKVWLEHGIKTKQIILHFNDRSL